MNTTTALEPIARAKLALASADREQALITLAKQSSGIVAITNKAGYEECQRARMRLKTQRVDIEKLGKTAREDATAFSKSVIAEQLRLIGFIINEEVRLEDLQETWDAAIQAEIEAKKKAEEERVFNIKTRIATLAFIPSKASLEPSEGLRFLIEKVTAAAITEPEFQEFYIQALAAKKETLAMLSAMLHDRLLQEEEEAKIEASRQLLAVQQARQAEEKAKHDAEIARDVEEMKERKQLQEAEIQRQENAIRIAREVLEEARRKVQREEMDRQAKIKADADSEAHAARHAQEVEMRKRSDIAAAEQAERERPELERLADWIIECQKTAPRMMTERGVGSRYVAEIYALLGRVLVEINLG